MNLCNILTKEFLFDKYIVNGLSSVEIADYVGCSKPTILFYLKLFNIKLRTISESRLLRAKFNRKTKLYLKNNLISNKNWLQDKYEQEKLTAKEISIIANCTISTVYNRLNEYNIIRRKAEFYPKKSRKGIPIFSLRNRKRPVHSLLMIGENNPNWKGGISKFPYAFDFNKKLKTKIRKRDKFICQICGKNGFIIHHIDYNKLNCDENNLITLCRSCHSKTNYNRNNWIKFFVNKGDSNVKNL